MSEGALECHSPWRNSRGSGEQCNHELKGAEISMLCGNLCAILCGGILTIVVSFVTNRSYKASDKTEEWEKTRDIDNPLSPWVEQYIKEFDYKGSDDLSDRPPLNMVFRTFRSARFVAYGGAITLTVVLIIIWPAAAYSLGVFNYEQFKHWLNVSQAWGFISAVVIIVMPVVSEVLDVYRGFQDRKKTAQEGATEQNDKMLHMTSQNNGVVKETNEAVA